MAKHIRAGLSKRVVEYSIDQVSKRVSNLSKFHKELKERMAAAGILGWALCISTLAFSSLVSARIPENPPERIVEIKKASADAEQLLFSMAYAMQPVCQKRGKSVWRFGPLPRTIPFERLEKFPVRQAEHDLISKTFNVLPGGSIFLTGIDKTPWGYSGLKAFEPVLFEKKGGSFISDLLGIYPNLTAQERANKEQEYLANPIREFPVLLNGTSSTVRVRRVPVCLYDLAIVDSRLSYADSDFDTLILSLPLLQRLTRTELTVVLAHEISQIALGNSEASATPGKVFETILAPHLAGALLNSETGLSQPTDDKMVAADRLAMRLVNGFDVNVSAYVQTIEKLAGESDFLGSVNYKRTRGIGNIRMSELKRSHALWDAEKKFLIPKGVEVAVFREVGRRASEVSVHPERVFGNSANLSLTQIDRVSKDASIETEVPLPSGFAEVGDVEAVPKLGAKGKELYREWLLKPNPRAIALSDTGAMARGYGTNSQAQAKANCEKFGNPCRIYAVDDTVIWMPK